MWLVRRAAPGWQINLWPVGWMYVSNYAVLMLYFVFIERFIVWINFQKIKEIIPTEHDGSAPV